MSSIDVEALISVAFKKGYELGKRDGNEGLHICPSIVLKQFIKSEALITEVKGSLEIMPSSPPN
ncbi:hypothetical protein [Flocculibacter collagenilyticus]|uniref:hypothetical protein n=1 Tax=Flocculibacter collagenilyticus TaxID=2744479 RepID=UPI0018F78D4E|nr:hypothetical protein [Flocculibacter collagenilyticus]